MSFAWPYALLALLVVPATAAAYVWRQRRRRRQAVRHPSVALLRTASPGRATWRRHLPLALALAAFACLVAAAARPQLSAEVPVSRSTVILAVDVSGSMCSTDVQPNRLAAAQQAVTEFIEAQDEQTQIGLVVFAGSAQIAVAPTTERDELTQAVATLTTGRGTTIGAAILKAIDAIAEINPNVQRPEAVPGGPDGTAPDGGSGPTGSFEPEIVVLLTDGANTRGVTPAEAAQVAAAEGVRVYPIAFGTTNPTAMVCSAEQLGGLGSENPFRGLGGGVGRDGRGCLVVDEPALREVAETTGGTFFSAGDTSQLQGVLADLPRQVVVQRQDLELGVGFVGLGALLALLSVAASSRWRAFP